MIHFNDDVAMTQRSSAQPLTLEQEISIVSALNSKEFTPEVQQLIQQMVYRYEVMCHYVAYTHGLWVSEQEHPESFQLSL